MDGSMEWLSMSAFARAMRDIVWLWPALESIHFLGLGLVIGAAGYLDLRLMGFMRGVPIRAVKAFIPWAMAGFAMNLVSGVLFFIMAPEMYAFSFAFWCKMAFI